MTGRFGDEGGEADAENGSKQAKKGNSAGKHVRRPTQYNGAILHAAS